jgi:putative transposase
VLAYCLMPNHVHLIARPANDTGLARAMAVVSATYARFIQARRDLPGHLWQGRYASFPMDDTYLYRCVRYVGLNPVRASLVTSATDWPWSSVRAHLGGVSDPLLTPEPVAELLGDDAAWAFGSTRKDDAIWAELRRATRYGNPLGSSDWIKGLP